MEDFTIERTYPLKKLFFVMFLLVLCTQAYASDVTLAWDAAPNAAWGTRIYIGTTTGDYTASHDAGAGTTQAVVINLQPGKTYYFAARHYYNGMQSGLSNEVNVAIAPEYTILPGIEPIDETVKTYKITIRRVED